MNGLENMLTVLRHERGEWVPKEMGFTPSLTEIIRERIGEKDFQEYFRIDTRGVGFATGSAFSRERILEYLDPELRGEAMVGEWGNTEIRGTYYHFTKKAYPLEKVTNIKELEKYPFPDPNDPLTYSHLKAQVAELHKQGFPVIGGLACTIFEIAWYLRRMENLFFDFIENEEFAEYYLDRITAIRRVQAERYAEADVDVLGLGDDVGSQKGMLMSAKVWRKWLKPRLADVIKSAKRKKPEVYIYYHSDGNVEEIIPELIEIGVEILNPVQPECMDPYKIGEVYGDKLTLWGTIGTQSTMPFGTPEEVEYVVKERIEKLGKNGGLVLAPTHVLEPEVPLENIERFAGAVEKYGRRI